jgi:hypothetical protein
MPTVSISLDAAKASSSMAEFFERLRGEMDATGKRIAEAGGRDIVSRVEGHNVNVRRVDTHRYASSWVVATADASGASIGSTEATEPGDASGSVVARPDGVTADLQSNVEYGPYLEYGTPRMAAGWHVQSARESVSAHAGELVDPAIVAAWGS